jgi:SAM-dependent methyltransferase
VDRTARILEIGPGYNPVAPKSGGWNTHVVDHATRDELRRKYSSAAVNLDAFEEVDTVWNGCALHEAIPAELLGSFDIIIASHVLEHVPDLVGFLQSATRLLQPAGVVSLAIPDRRFCFDYFKPPSGTGDVLEAFLQQRTRHSLRSSWNHVAYATRMDGLEAWAQHAVFNPEFIDSFDTATSVLQNYRNGGPDSYVDCHAWLLTPAAFKLIILELGLLGLIDQRITALYGPEGCEFFATLERGAERFNDPAQARSLRKCLLLEQLREWREQLDYAIAGGLTPAAGSSSGAVAARFSDRIAEQDGRITELDRRVADVTTELNAVSGRLAEVQVSEGKLTNAISARLAELETARVALAAELSGVAQGLAAVQSVLGKMIGPLWPIRKAAALVRSLRGR